jgi:pilus assembly protein CpaB
MAARNVLIALGALALVLGLMLATFWLVRAPSSGGAARTAPQSEAILLAARPVPRGTLLRSEDMTWENRDAGKVAPGNIARSQTSETLFLGSVARRDFAAGEPLMATDLVKSGERAFLSGVLAPGDRAVAIAVDAPQSAAGLALPGDRVDVILTQNFGSETAGNGRKAVGETVLTNVRVIAVDQWLNTTAKPGGTDKRMGTTEAQMPRTITLEVSELEAERVLVAVQLGKVQFAVRALEGTDLSQGGGDNRPEPIWAYDVSPALGMLGRVSSAPPAMSAPPALPVVKSSAPAIRASSIEILHGSKSDIR